MALINRRNGPRYQRVLPSLMRFFFFFLNRGNTEGTNSSRKKKVWFLCLFSVHLCQDWFLSLLDNLWFDDLRAGLKKKKKKGDRLNFVFSPDATNCGWLGSKYQPTNWFLLTAEILLYPHNARALSSGLPQKDTVSNTNSKNRCPAPSLWLQPWCNP